MEVINSKKNLRENLGGAEVEPVLLLQLELVTPELLDLLAPSNDKVDVNIDRARDTDEPLDQDGINTCYRSH